MRRGRAVRSVAGARSLDGAPAFGGAALTGTDASEVFDLRVGARGDAGADSSPGRPPSVLIVTAHFPPDRAAGTHRILRLTRHLRQRGWRVAILTIDPRSYRPGTPIDARLSASVPDDVAVYRTSALRALAWLARWRRRLRPSTPSPTPASAPAAGRPSTERARRRGRMARLSDAISGLLSFPDADVGWMPFALPRGLVALRRERVDLIVSSAPPFTCHVLAGLLARLSGARWVADFRDSWARAPWGGEALLQSWKGVGRRVLERWMVGRAEAVVMNTERMRREFASHYGDPIARKLTTVTNGYDLDALGPFIRVPRRSGEGLLLTHAGSLYRERDPRPLFHALASGIARGRLPAKGIRLELLGSVSPAFRALETVRELGLTDVVSIVPAVPHRECLERLAASDVLVVVQPGTDLQVPVKLYEYLPFGKPIVALTSQGAVADAITDGRLGWAIEPWDIDALEDVLTRLWAFRADLGRLVQADERYVARFDGRQVAERFGAVLDACLGERCSA